LWHLWAFGAATGPIGLWLWHRQGPHFGLGPANGWVSRRAAKGTMIVFLALLGMGFAVGGE
jgi:hypothetical protein